MISLQQAFSLRGVQNLDVLTRFCDSMEEIAKPLIEVSYGVPPASPPDTHVAFVQQVVSRLAPPIEAQQAATEWITAISDDVSVMVALLSAGAANISSSGVGIPPAEDIMPTNMLDVLQRSDQNDPKIAYALMDWIIGLLPDEDVRLAMIKPTVG